jgi:diketogulonate reductase-like aldo/keto reductase
VKKGKVRNIGVSKYVVRRPQLLCNDILNPFQFQHRKVTRSIRLLRFRNDLTRLHRLRKITDGDISIFPSVNQVELNFWNPQPNLVKWSKENGILLEAYSPLGSTKYVSKSLNVPEVSIFDRFFTYHPSGL